MTNKISESARKVADLAGEKLGSASEHVRDSAHTAREKTQAAYSASRAKASDALHSGKEKASQLYATSREKADHAYASAHANARAAKDKTAQKVQENPLAFLIGGIAVGALAGALLPRTERETKALGNAGKKISETATGAAKAAKEAGQHKLDALGINKDAAKSQISQIISSVVSAVEEAGSAAKNAVGSKTNKP